MTNWLSPNPFQSNPAGDPSSSCERQFPGMSKTEHERAARRYARMAREVEAQWGDEVRAAAQKYGDHGPLVSGVYRNHFPDRVKERLRQLVRKERGLLDQSTQHWMCAGKRMSTWRKELGR